MRKTLFFNIIIFAASVLFAGCNLTSEEYSQISSDLYPVTERDAYDILTGAAYSPFSADGWGNAFSSSNGFFALADIATDFGYCSWAEETWGPLEFAMFDGTERTGDASAYNPRTKWGSINQLSKMELAISRIKGIIMDENLQARYIAELECAQGFMAFMLWDFYGGLVIADLETLKNPQEGIILPRKSSDETVNYIKNKLNSAKNVLPTTIQYGSADYGRFTRGLCHTLLLKLYMQTKDWTNAEIEGRELMKPEYGYALVRDKGDMESAYANIFSDANEGNSETVWAVNLAVDHAMNYWYFTVVDWGGFKISPSFYQTFEAGDQRKGGAVIEDQGSGKYLPLKYEVYKCPGGDCVTDWIIYRYADVITLLAEAIVKKSNSVTGEAIDLLNQVRTRAGLTAYTAADLPDVNTFVEKLLWERAHELWYEGCRRQDLIRNNVYAATMAKKCEDYGKSKAHLDILGEANSHLFPLPSSAINEFRKGGFANQQNPGYGD
ncbi:MAG: RagB/SusD family nutrient uptake outer membrane protein [Prevotellaceae bacterium]|jgi:hypothetical protein|nr:RagB/SusD family nutrient uptake outer membrane protein [Prevotellaceae bacterium]